MQVGHVVTFCTFKGGDLRVIEVASFDNHFGTPGAKFPGLRHRCPLGQIDNSPAVGGLRRIGNGKAVVVSRCGDDATAEGFLVELQDGIARPSRLERSGDLQAFEFEHQRTAVERVPDEAGSQAWRAPHPLPDAPGRGDNVVGSWPVDHGHDSGFEVDRAG